MEQNILEKQRDLNDRLNRYRDEYYNRNAPSVSDEVYDRLFDELKELEQETGIQMANSPTQTVGYPAVSRLEKTRHEIPLLSLDKTKSSMDLLNFMGEQQVMLMLKLDGLTVKLTYENGELLEAATRGDGDEGEIITHNTRAISGIPSHITYKERLVVTGEGFIRPSDFEELKTSLQDSSGKPYKNGRNLAAGSIRLMDAKTCRERRLVFMPFGVLEGFPHLTRKSDKLRELRALGFQPCKYLVTKQKLTLENVEAGIYQLRQYATDKDIPIDGIVVSFNDIAYAQSCGRTGHHYKDGLAYKFEDDLHESLLQYIEWTPGRTGEIAPVAVFTPVEIDGCEVSRASLHNLSFIEDLELMAGNRILVSKRNMIIPHVEENLDRGGFSMVDTIPHVCPCCGQPTRIHESSGKGENGEDRIIKTLYCDNPDCETRRLKKFVHFVSQKAMDIEGLSEATLEKFIGQGFIHSYLDIYRLDRYRAEIVRMDGFGEKSWQRLWDAIQQSRNTTFERYLISMDIPMIGNTASKVLGRVFHYDLDEFRDAVYGGYDFRQLPDFGETLHNNTCLSYRTGSQRECLLAAFDSNKKIILVKKDEAVVARACLRMTKGAFQKPPAVDFSFADLSQENTDSGKSAADEKAVLFLESIYTFGLNDVEKEEVMKLAVSLTTQKAAELGVVAVLARRYLGCYERDEYVLAPFYVYISKSKNGWQYLDSLGGAAYTSAKEEYVEHPFLVMQTAMHQAEANSRNEVYYE